MITEDEFKKFKEQLQGITSPKLATGDPLFGNLQFGVMTLVKNKTTGKTIGIKAIDGWNDINLTIVSNPKDLAGNDSDPAKEYEEEGLTLDDVANAITSTFNENRLMQVGTELFTESIDDILKAFYPKMYRGLLQLSIVRDEKVKSIYVHENEQLGKLELVYSPSTLAVASLMEFGANMLKSSDRSRVSYKAAVNFIEAMGAFIVMHELSHLIYRHIHDNMPLVSSEYDKSQYENYLADQYINNRLAMVMNNNPVVKQSLVSMGIPSMSLYNGMQDKITSQSTINPELTEPSPNYRKVAKKADCKISVTYQDDVDKLNDFLKGSNIGDKILITVQNRSFGTDYDNFSRASRDIFKFFSDLNSTMTTNDRSEEINEKVQDNQIQQQVDNAVNSSNLSDDEKKQVADAIKKSLDDLKKAARNQANRQNGQSGQSGQSSSQSQSGQQGGQQSQGQSGQSGQSGQGQSGQGNSQGQSGQSGQGQSGQGSSGAPSNSLTPDRQSRANNPSQNGQGSSNNLPSNIDQTQVNLNKILSDIASKNSSKEGIDALNKISKQVADKLNRNAENEKARQTAISKDKEVNNNVKKTSLRDLKKTPDSFDKSLIDAAKELTNEESKASQELQNNKGNAHLETDPAVIDTIKRAESSTGKVAKGWRAKLKSMMEDSTGVQIEYNPSAPNARIQGQFGREEIHTELGDLVLSFDVSGSMDVTDFKAALTYVSDMMKMRLNFDKVGFIYWGDNSEGFKPKNIPTNQLYKKALEYNKGGRRGTNFTAAFEQFTKGNLKSSRPDLVIVFTDGEITFDGGTNSKEYKWYKRNKRKVLFVLKPNSSRGKKTLLKIDPSVERRMIEMTDNTTK